MKYEFGVMSNKWILEADDMFTAYITMSMFIGQNVPIAVYSPQKYGFMPKEILDNNMDNFKPEKVKECFKTIQEVKSGCDANDDGIPPNNKLLGILPTIL